MITIIKVLGIASVQDLGAHGRMHEAVPPGGALVHELLVRANRLAKNRDGARAIEIMGRITVRADRDLEIATDEFARALRAGETITIASERHRVAYFTVFGEITTPRAQLYANEGAVRAGDVIAVDVGAPAQTKSPKPFELRDVRVAPGPDFVDDALFSAPYRVLHASDRAGTRLEGPRLAHKIDGRSRPMTCGAIEAPPDGQPIVLGPDHPTTGGYPLCGVVLSADLGVFFAVPLGGAVRFVRAPTD